MARVLVADDDEGFLKVAKRYFGGCGHEVVTAKDGQEALELLQRDNKFDMLLSDNDMPRLGGLALTNSPEAKVIPLRILYSGKFMGVIINNDVWHVPKIDTIINSKGEETTPYPFIEALLNGRDMSSFLSETRER